MAVKINRLPSGSYRALVYIGKDAAGKRKFESVTGSSKRDVAARAAEIALKAQRNKISSASDMTVGEAIDKYIEKQTALLSPSTILGYKRYRKNHYQSIAGIKLCNINNDILEDYLIELANTKSQGTRAGKPLSAKTVSNIWRLLTAAINKYAPDFKIHAVPPSPRPIFYDTPNVAGVQAILKAAEGVPIETAIYLAARCGLRASEILGLRWGDISDDHIYIHRTRVTGDDGSKDRERTKTASSTRYFMLSPDQSAYLAEKRKGNPSNARVLDMTVENLSKTFQRFLERNGLPHCRFHDLRHAYASIEHLNGTPDAYIMRQGGWNSTLVLRRIYTQTFDDEMLRFAVKSDLLYRSAVDENQIQHEIQHENEKMA